MQKTALWIGIGVVVGFIIGMLVFHHKAQPVAGGAGFPFGPNSPLPVTTAGMPGNVPGNPAQLSQAIALGATQPPALSPEDLKKVQNYAKSHGGKVVVDLDEKGRVKTMRPEEK